MLKAIKKLLSCQLVNTEQSVIAIFSLWYNFCKVLMFLFDLNWSFKTALLNMFCFRFFKTKNTLHAPHS